MNLELNGIVVVSPGGSRDHCTGISAHHIGQMSEGHGLSFSGKRPTPVVDQVIYTAKKPFRTAKKEKRVDNSFCCRGPVPDV